MGGQSALKDLCIYGGCCLPVVAADAINNGVLSLNEYLTPEQTGYAASLAITASSLCFLGLLLKEQASEVIREYNLHFPNLWEIYNQKQ